METNEVKNVLEALLFVSERPLTLKELKSLLSEDYDDLENIENLLNELKTEYETLNKPYEIKFLAEGWTFATKADYSPWIKKLFKRKFVFRMSPSALETLAIVAYKQPVTRADIDDIRGVESSGVLDTLLERKLVKIVGRKEALGHPLLYATTQEFMKHFGLSHLNDLPSIENNPDLEIIPDEEQTEDVPELPFEKKEKEKEKEVEKEAPEKEEIAEEQ